MPAPPPRACARLGSCARSTSLSYRDDHDAAISRIAALEQELAAAEGVAQARSDRDERRIAMLERELADLRRHEPTTPRRARPPSTPPVPRAARTAIDELALRGPSISRALLVVLSLFAAGVITVAIMMARGDHPRPPTKSCTVDSSPSRARVYGITGSREVDLGTAPVELLHEEWATYGTIQFRIPGYDTLSVASPKSAAQCPRDAYELYVR